MSADEIIRRAVAEANDPVDVVVDHMAAHEQAPPSSSIAAA